MEIIEKMYQTRIIFDKKQDDLHAIYLNTDHDKQPQKNIHIRYQNILWKMWFEFFGTMILLIFYTIDINLGNTGIISMHSFYL